MALDVSRPDLSLAVIGTGVMGRGIAQIAAQAGIRVLLHDSRPGAAREAKESVSAQLARLADKGRIEREAVERAEANLVLVDSLQALSSCPIVIEAVAENLETNRDLFRSLEENVPEDCLMASNTSSFYITAIDAPCKRPQPIAAGLLGRKSGSGFYRYEEGRKKEIPEPPPPAARPRRVWISPIDLGEQLSKCVEGLEVEIDSGRQPWRDSLCLVAPIGDDATSIAIDQELDPGRTVAVDCLFRLDKRRTLMTTPVTSAQMRDAAHGLFAGDGIPVTVIHDSPGFVAQRVIAQIVNVASDIAQQRIASPADIDLAVTLGLGYPQGPLAWGDAIGAGAVLDILEALHEFYGDPRYRPSPWLKRRAMLGVSLLTAAA